MLHSASCTLRPVHGLGSSILLGGLAGCNLVHRYTFPEFTILITSTAQTVSKLDNMLSLFNRLRNGLPVHALALVGNQAQQSAWCDGRSVNTVSLARRARPVNCVPVGCLSPSPYPGWPVRPNRFLTFLWISMSAISAVLRSINCPGQSPVPILALH